MYNIVLHVVNVCTQETTVDTPFPPPLSLGLLLSPLLRQRVQLVKGPAFLKTSN